MPPPRPLVPPLPPWLLATTLAGLAVGTLLAGLGAPALHLWDEARLAVNALEMLHRHHGLALIVTYDDQPDHWNTKPPLLIWLQMAAMAAFGATEWAVRLPSALAALGTVALVFGFAARVLKRPSAGFWAGLILISAPGFAGDHVARNADYDALLTFFQTLTGLAIFIALTSTHHLNRAWAVGAAALALAVLTKGVAGLLGLPGLVAWVLFSGHARRALRAPGCWLAALGVAAVTIGWYALREHLAPGYWAAVQTNELGGRFATTLEEHRHPWYYYLHMMVRGKFLPWVYLLPLAVPAVWRYPDARTRQAARLALSWAGGYLLLISVAQTKLFWYAAPAYPWLALMVGLAIPRLGHAVMNHWPHPTVRHGMRVLAVALLLIPYGLNVRAWVRRLDPHDDLPESPYGYALRTLKTTATATDTLTLLAASGYNASLRFYCMTYPAPVRLLPANAAGVAALRPGERVVTCADSVARLVQARFPTAPFRPLGVPSRRLFLIPRAAR